MGMFKARIMLIGNRAKKASVKASQPVHVAFKSVNDIEEGFSIDRDASVNFLAHKWSLLLIKSSPHLANSFKLGNESDRLKDLLPAKTEKLDCDFGFQHSAFTDESHRPSTGLHCTKVKIIAREQKMELLTMQKYKSRRRQVLFPMMRRIRKATDILPVATAAIANVWVIQLSLKAGTSSLESR